MFCHHSICLLLSRNSREAEPFKFVFGKWHHKLQNGQLPSVFAYEERPVARLAQNERDAGLAHCDEGPTVPAADSLNSRPTMTRPFVHMNLHATGRRVCKNFSFGYERLSNISPPKTDSNLSVRSEPKSTLTRSPPSIPSNLLNEAPDSLTPSAFTLSPLSEYWPLICGHSSIKWPCNPAFSYSFGMSAGTGYSGTEEQDNTVPTAATTKSARKAQRFTKVA